MGTALATKTAKVAKRRGPKPRFAEPCRDIHISLPVSMLVALDAVATRGRADYIIGALVRDLAFNQMWLWHKQEGTLPKNGDSSNPNGTG